MIRIHQGILYAQNVINHLMATGSLDEVEAYVESFTNCREQGYMLWFTSTATVYYIANNRNSDHIVVYKGVYNISNKPSEDEWKSRKFFDYGNYKEAADWILEDSENAWR